MHTANNSTLDTFRRFRDEASFRRLYRIHTPTLFAVAMRLAGNRTMAEELTQETWVRAITALDSFDGRSQFSTWLTGILINCLRETRRDRDQKHSVLHDEDVATANVVAAFPNPHTTADKTDLERALVQLAPGYREVVLLHDLYGYTHLEIAAMLGIQEGTSKSQLVRGRAQLRELLTSPHATLPEPNERGAT